MGINLIAFCFKVSCLVGLWRNLVDFLELFVKVGRVVEPGLITYLRYGQVPLNQQFTSMTNSDLIQEL